MLCFSKTLLNGEIENAMLGHTQGVIDHIQDE